MKYDFGIKFKLVPHTGGTRLKYTTKYKKDLDVKNKVLKNQLCICSALKYFQEWRFVLQQRHLRWFSWWSTGRIIEELRVLYPSGSPSFFQHRLAQWYESAQATLIQIQYFCRTHRNVLAAVSDYFRAMLTGSMIEARQDHVNLKGVTSHAVKILLDFAYTGRSYFTLVSF